MARDDGVPQGSRGLLSVAVAVGHGEDVAVEDAELGAEGQNGVLALVVLPAAAVCFCEQACDKHRSVRHAMVTRTCALQGERYTSNLPRSPNEGALLPEPHHRVPGTMNPRLVRWRLLPFDPAS